MNKTMLITIVAIAFPLATGCQMSTMEATQQGHQLSKLPWGIGGMKEDVIPPGTTDFYPFWVDTYKVDTGVYSISWAGSGVSGDHDAVNTRAIDGNEVFQGTDVRTRYQIGLAHTVNLELTPGPHRLSVALPNRNLTATAEFDPQESGFIGISRLNNRLEIKLSGQQFLYA